MCHFIYVIENKIDDRLYVGQTTQLANRENSHFAGKSGAKFLNRAIFKHGSDKFEFVLLEKCITQSEADSREIYWIECLNSLVPSGYNLTKGGGGVSGYLFSEQQREALSKSLKGIVRSEETKKKMSQSKLGTKNPMYGRSGEKSPNFGTKRSAETKANMSQRAKERFKIKENHPLFGKRGDKSPWFGRKHSEETKKKISLARRNKESA